MFGEVKWFNANKGWGFIKTTHGDVLVHYKDVFCFSCSGFRILHPHDNVVFDEVHDKKGLRAKNVFKV